MVSIFKLPRLPASPAESLALPKKDKGKRKEKDDGDEKSLRIAKSKAGRGEERAARSIPAAMKKLHHLLRQSAGRHKSKARGGRGRMPPGAPFGAQALQRVAVRATYSSPKVAGQWAAHGRYLERESANGAPGFGPAEEQVELSKTLGEWQEAGDPRLWKFIISPENPGIDLRDFTRAYMAQVAEDLGCEIQWIAQDHYNTDNPHVHVALRGVDSQGREIRIDPEYIKKGLRLRAQQEATRRLGLRTERDVLLAAERDVEKSRFTDLDRRLKHRADNSPWKTGSSEDGPDAMRGVIDYTEGASKAMDLILIKRLAHLEKMGLAKRIGDRRWTLAPHMENALRERAKSDDRLKLMFENREVASDPRCPLRHAKVEIGAPVRGKLIATGADDATGKPFALVEVPAGEVLYLMQNDAFSEARNKGMKIGAFVELSVENGVRWRNDAEKLLADPVWVREEAKRFVEKHKSLPPAQVYGGWIGRYQAALHEAGKSLERVHAVQREGERATLREPGRRGPDRSSR